MFSLTCKSSTSERGAGIIFYIEVTTCTVVQYLSSADSVIKGHPLCRDSITMYRVIFNTNYPLDQRSPANASRTGI